MSDHKGSVNGRRNLHDLLVHPIYTTPQQHPHPTSTAILPLMPHDLQSLGSPLPHIAPIHVPPLVPISPTTAATSVESPAGNPTLTSLDSHSNHVTGDSSQSPPGGHSDTTQGEPLVPFYTQLTPIHTSHPTPPNTESASTVPPVIAASRGGRKRKSSGSGGTANGKVVHVKQEPGFAPDISSSDSNCSNNNAGSSNNGNSVSVDDDYGFDFSGDPSMFLDSNYQCIKFQSFQENTWHTLADEAFKEL